MSNNTHNPFHTQLSSAGFLWLKQLKQLVSKKFLQDEITTHPDYPALSSFTDTLIAGGFQFYVLRGDASSVNEYDYPLLAHIKKDEQQALLLLNNAKEWEQQKQWTTYWTGIVIFAEEGATFKNAANDLQLTKEKRNNYFTTAGLCLIVFFVAGIYYNTASLLAAAFATLSGAGLLASILTLSAELGTQSAIVKQVCGAVSANGCGAVLKSNKAKGIFGITPADLSIGWFATQLLLLTGSIFINPAYYLLPAIYWSAMLGLPVAAWSLYTQKMVVKQWCALCLGILAVLLLQATIAGVAHPFFIISAAVIIIFLITGLLIMLAWLPIKGLLKSHIEAIQTKRELARWKKTPSIFNVLLQNEPGIDCTPWQGELQLGNADAALQITVACNTYCGPCANAHKKLDKILEAYPDDVGICLRFICVPQNKDDMHTMAVTAILQKANETDNKEQLKQMLADWFNWMDIEKWKVAWQPTNNFNVTKLLVKHDEWIKDAATDGTPTLFINGKKVPNRYGLDDIKIMIPELAALFEPMAAYTN